MARLFAHDTEVALLGAAALVNTAGPAARSGMSDPAAGPATSGPAARADTSGSAGAADTGGAGPDGLADPAALDRFVAEWGWTGSRRHDRAELEQVRDLRPVLARLWDADEGAVVALTNELLRLHSALPQLVRHDGWPWHLHATSPDAPLADRMAVEAAMAMVDVVRQGELGRLRRCGAEDCGAVMVDLSRNSSKRYCSTTCANRVNVAAFRSRRIGPGDASPAGAAGPS